MPRLKLLFVVSECVPFAKTGGLADVAGALPTALAKRGHDVRVLMPRYRCTRAQPTERLPEPFGVSLGPGHTRWCGLHRGALDGGVPVYLLEHDVLYDREGIYGDAYGSFGDNALRYALLCRAALQLPAHVGFEPDLMHVHDWQASLVPVLLAAERASLPSVLTIHNLGYQGVFGFDAAPNLGLSMDALEHLGVEHFGALNLLKGGLLNATTITTVSPRYALEIQTSEGGVGLDGVLRSRRDAVFGILNGIDEEVWDPATDRHLPAHYSASDLSNKARCKEALQAELGLEVRADVPLLGIVSRFAPQKGIDLVVEALPMMLDLDVQLAVVGSGEEWAETLFRRLNGSTNHVRAFIGYDERLAHRVEAGSDLFLMPSRYEPCGLNQLYSQRYGTPPIVRAVGGLMDTVTHGVDGFAFQEMRAWALYRAVAEAVATYRERPDTFTAIQTSGMRKKLGWDRAASSYEALYRMALTTASRL